MPRLGAAEQFQFDDERLRRFALSARSGAAQSAAFALGSAAKLWVTESIEVFSRYTPAVVGPEFDFVVA